MNPAANRPAKKEAIKPTRKGVKEKLFKLIFSIYKSRVTSKIFPPIIVGIAKRKEKVIAFFISHPRKLAADMVDPLLESPGISAMMIAPTTGRKIMVVR